VKIFLLLLSAHFKNVIRDRMSIFWFLAFPVLFVFLFGIIFGGFGDSWSLKVGVAESEQFVYEEEVFSRLRGIKGVQLLKVQEEAIDELLHEGKVDVVLDFQKDKLLVFAASQGVEKAQLVSEIIRSFALDRELRMRGYSPAFSVEVRTLDVAQFRQIEYFLPGVLAMALMQLGLFGSLDFVSLREKKIIRYLAALPLRRELLLWSEISMRVLIAFLQTGVIIASGWLFFGVHFSGSLAFLFLWVVFGSATFVSLGYFLISFTRTLESAEGIIQMVQFPMMFLSGIFFSPEVMPAPIRFVVRLLPLSYLGDALRSIAVGIPTQFGLRVDFLVLLGWLLASFLLAWRFFRWE